MSCFLNHCSPLTDAHGGLGKMHPLFGEAMDLIIEELNQELTA